jgi:hypothetical protein
LYACLRLLEFFTGLFFQWLASEKSSSTTVAQQLAAHAGSNNVLTANSATGGVTSLCSNDANAWSYFHPAGADTESHGGNGNTAWTNALRGAWGGFGDCR